MKFNYLEAHYTVRETALKQKEDHLSICGAVVDMCCINIPTSIRYSMVLGSSFRHIFINANNFYIYFFCLGYKIGMKFVEVENKFHLPKTFLFVNTY